jgi:hypothetical protein
LQYKTPVYCGALLAKPRYYNTFAAWIQIIAGKQKIARYLGLKGSIIITDNKGGVLNSLRESGGLLNGLSRIFGSNPDRRRNRFAYPVRAGGAGFRG